MSTLDELKGALHWALCTHGENRGHRELDVMLRDLVLAFQEATGLTREDIEGLMARKTFRDGLSVEDRQMGAIKPGGSRANHDPL